MFGRTSVMYGKRIGILVLALFFACTAIVGCQVEGTNLDPPVEPVAGIVPPLAQFLEAFVSAERSLIIRGDVDEGRGELAVESSVCATFEWVLEVIERDDSGRIVSRTPLASLSRPFLDVVLPGIDQISAQSVARILDVLSDPGADGTEIIATVTIRSTADAGENCTPAEAVNEVVTRELTLFVTRRGGPLTVTLSSAGGSRVAPGETLELSAVISGGRPFLDDPFPCDGLRAGLRPGNSGTPYEVDWNLTVSDVLLDPDSVGSDALFEVDCLELGDGVTETRGLYTAPNVTGNVLASIAVVDARGNRSTASLSIVVGSPEALTFAQASIEATRIAPGDMTNIIVEPEGGTAPYDVTIELANTASERIGDLRIGSGAASASTGCTNLTGGSTCEAIYAALADKTGNDLIRITAIDAVGDEISTTIPLTVASAQTLSLSVTAAPPVIFFSGGMGTLTANVAGGTEPYQVCFEIEPGSIDGMTLSTDAGGAGCSGIGSLTNCSCGLMRPDANSPAPATRLITAGGNEGFVTVRVQAEDAVGDASTQFVSIDVSRFSGTGQVSITDLIVDAHTDGDPTDDASEDCLRVGDDGTGSPVETVALDMMFTGGIGPFDIKWTTSRNDLGSFDPDDSDVDMIEIRSVTAATWYPDLPFAADATVDFTGEIVDTRIIGSGDSITKTVRLHFAAVANNSGAVCDGRDVTLFGGPAGQTEYQWRDPASVAVDVDGLDTDRLLSPAVGGTYSLTIVTADGCLDTATTDVVVNEVPVADPGMDLLGANGICGNEPITVGAPMPAMGGTPPFDCAWVGSGAPFLSDTNACDPLFDPQDEDFMTVRYALTLTVTDSSSTMCGSAAETIEIDVFPVPTAFAGGDMSVCADEPLMLGGFPAATGGVGGYAFEWAGPCVGFLDDPTLPNPTIDPPDDTEMVCDFTLSATDLNGCIATDDVTITVNSVPVPDPGMSMIGPNSVCAAPGRQIGGSPSATGGTPPYTYEWTGTCASFLDDVTAENPFFEPLNNKDLTCTLFLTVTDADNCDATSGLVLIEIDPSPTADAGMDETICSGDVTLLGGVDAVSGGTPPYVITWSSTPGCVGLLDSTTIENPTFDTSASGFVGTCTFTLDVTDSTGCGDQDMVSITVGENPTADAGMDLTGANGVCDNEDPMIGGSPAVVGGTGPFDFAWTGTCVDMGFVSNPAIANPMISPPDDTSAMCDLLLTVTDANVCIDTDMISVDISPSSVVNAGLDFTLCPGDMQQIGGSPTVSGGTAPLTIQWIGASLDDTTAANPVFTAPVNDGAAIQPFNFTVQVTSDANTCTSRNQDGMSIDVRPSTNITMQPPAMVMGQTGDSVTITLDATGDMVALQWQFASNGVDFVDLTDGGRISGTTTGSLTIDPVNSTDEGSYQCIVDGTCDAGAITSSVAELTVQCPVDPPTVMTPSVCSCFESGSMNQTISVVGGGDNRLFQWQKLDVSSGLFVNILDFIDDMGMPLQNIEPDSVITDTLEFTTADSGQHPGRYHCVVSNQCGSVISDEIELFVQSAPCVACP